jgi:hypothetical protein
VNEYGKSALRGIFQVVFPASTREFILILSSEVYWKNLSALTKLPDLIEIIIYLLGAYIKLI